MKPILCLVLIAVSTLLGCKKNDSLADLITGNWQLVSAYNGSASGGVYQSATSNLNVRFNADGSLGGNAFAGYNTYSVSPSSITITGPQGSVVYGYSFPDNVLQLNQVGCAGGCGQRFNKVP